MKTRGKQWFVRYANRDGSYRARNIARTATREPNPAPMLGDIAVAAPVLVEVEDVLVLLLVDDGFEVPVPVVVVFPVALDGEPLALDVGAPLEVVVPAGRPEMLMLAHVAPVSILS